MKDTLFDEKIAGSFHFTPGSAMMKPRMEISPVFTDLLVFSGLIMVEEKCFDGVLVERTVCLSLMN